MNQYYKKRSFEKMQYDAEKIEQRGLPRDSVAFLRRKKVATGITPWNNVPAFWQNRGWQPNTYEPLEGFTPTTRSLYHPENKRALWHVNPTGYAKFKAQQERNAAKYDLAYKKEQEKQQIIQAAQKRLALKNRAARIYRAKQKQQEFHRNRGYQIINGQRYKTVQVQDEDVPKPSPKKLLYTPHANMFRYDPWNPFTHPNPVIKRGPLNLIPNRMVSAYTGMPVPPPQKFKPPPPGPVLNVRAIPEPKTTFKTYKNLPAPKLDLSKTIVFGKTKAKKNK